MPNKTLFIYLDESGNLDFASSGTKHLVMSAVSTQDPATILKLIGNLKYELLAAGINVPNFHASEDVQIVRNRFFAILGDLPVYSGQTFWLSKDDDRLSEPFESSAYGSFGLAIANWAQIQKVESGSERVVLVFDRVLRVREQSAFLSRLKGIFSQREGFYYVFFHNVHKDFNGQVADYIAWAQYVKLERGEQRPFQELPVHLCQSDNLFDWLESH
ncbi:MAG: hypothetical protein RIQ88_495 [Actinomycetota bacterium]|jgi:hypothetical protein